MRANISASRISIPHHLTTENPEPGRRIWGRGDLKLWFLATNNTLREPLRLWTDTLTWSELLHASFLSQHFICKNSLELNSYMQKGSEFEEANTWVGRDATSKKKEVASRKDNLQSMKDTSEGETSIELIFKNSLQLKKKKKDQFPDLLAKSENQNQYCAIRKYSRGCCRGLPDPGERQDYWSFTSQSTWISCYSTSSCLLLAALPPAPQI